MTSLRSDSCASCQGHADLADLLKPAAQSTQEHLLAIRTSCLASDCDRFVRLTRERLRQHAQQFCTSLDAQFNYVSIYGGILGKLVHCEHSCSQHSPSIWVEVAKEFEKTATSWEERLRPLRLLQNLAQECSSAMIQQAGGHCQEFWETLGQLVARFKAAWDLNHVPPRGLETATAHLVELLWTIVDSQLQDVAPYPMRSSVAADYGPSRLILLARAILPMIYRGQLPFDDGISKWQQAVENLIKHFDRPWDPKLSADFERLVADLRKFWLNSHGKPNRREYKLVLDKITEEVARRAHDRPARKKIRHRTCKLEFYDNAGERLATTARIIDVCAKSFRGFCIETERLVLTPPHEYDYPEPPDEITPDNLRTRLVSVCSSHTAPHRYNRVKLTTTYSQGGVSRTLAVDCYILRAWPLKQRPGIGFAIMAPPAEDRVLAPEWKTYVERQRPV